MKSFVAFTKKEFLESWRTYRLIVLAAVMVLLGLMSPLFAKMMPQLLGVVDLGEGMSITMPEPTAMDSWAQFFSNVGQLGMLALIITFSGTMANELSRGTFVNLLTKGMKRHTVILAKCLTASTLWTLVYLLCFAVCFAYTEYFWPTSILSNAPLAFISLWLFGELLIALLIFGGTLFGNFYGSLLTALGVVIVMSLISIAPATSSYNPISLAGGTLSLLSGQSVASDFIPAIIICVGLTVVLVAASIVVFNKKKM